MSSIAPPAAGPSSTTTTHPTTGPPDLTQRNKLKNKYDKIQRKYFRTQTLAKDLKLEVDEKESKVQRLQDEINLLLDQIHASDYAHLVPKHDDYFSDDETAREPPNGDHHGHPPAPTNGAAYTNGSAAVVLTSGPTAMTHAGANGRVE